MLLQSIRQLLLFAAEPEEEAEGGAVASDVAVTSPGLPNRSSLIFLFSASDFSTNSVQ